MKNAFLLLSVSLCLSVLNSCMVASVVTAPIKVAGDVAEGAYNVGKTAASAVIPDGE